MLDLKTPSTIASSIIHTKLDYCNSLFLNIDITQINRLHAIQGAVTKTPKHHHFTPVLKTLNRLKIPERIEYKAPTKHFNAPSTPTSVSCSRSNHLVQWCSKVFWDPCAKLWWWAPWKHPSI